MTYGLITPVFVYNRFREDPSGGNQFSFSRLERELGERFSVPLWSDAEEMLDYTENISPSRFTPSPNGVADLAVLSTLAVHDGISQFREDAKDLDGMLPRHIPLVLLTGDRFEAEEDARDYLRGIENHVSMIVYSPNVRKRQYQRIVDGMKNGSLPRGDADIGTILKGEYDPKSGLSPAARELDRRNRVARGRDYIPKET